MNTERADIPVSKSKPTLTIKKFTLWRGKSELLFNRSGVTAVNHYPKTGCLNRAYTVNVLHVGYSVFSILWNIEVK